jgi:hypothetical protein
LLALGKREAMRGSASSISEAALSAEERGATNALLQAIEPLASLRGSMPLPYVTTFLTVALDEGKGVGAYARALGVHRAVMSRHLRDIGSRSRNGGPGLGLVRVKPHPQYAMNRQVFLTKKGCVLAKAIFHQMKRGGWFSTEAAESLRNDQIGDALVRAR